MSSVPLDKLSPAERSQLACTYATLILHDEKIDIKADKIAKIVSAAGVNVEAYWPKLIAKALEGKSVADFFGGGESSSSAPAATPAVEAKTEKKEAPKEAAKDKDAGKGKKKDQPKPAPVDDDDGGMGDLFG